MKYLFALPFWYCELCVESWWRWGRKHCLINNFFCGSASIFSGRWFVGWGKKTYWRAAEIATFSNRNLRRSNKHDSFWHIVSIGYFHILFLWIIAASYFIPFECYKNLDPPFFSITFTVNSHVDNHFYKYIYLFQTYRMEAVFVSKHMLKVH